MRYEAIPCELDDLVEYMETWIAVIQTAIDDGAPPSKELQIRSGKVSVNIESIKDLGFRAVMKFDRAPK